MNILFNILVFINFMSFICFPPFPQIIGSPLLLSSRDFSQQDSFTLYRYTSKTIFSILPTLPSISLPSINITIFPPVSFHIKVSPASQTMYPL